MLSLPQHITLLHHVSLLAGVAVCFAWTAPTGAVQPEAFSAGPGARQINADINGDGMVNLDDFMILAACMAGPDEPVPPPGCIHGEFAASDLDGDADVDLRDFALFAEHFVQPPPDCNENGIPDDVDIAEGTSQDCNKNGVPDECDLADGTSEDCNENGVPDECDISGAVTAPNLVHRYRFDGTTADSMGGGDAVLYGGTSLSEDSLVLSGVDGHAELPIAGTIASLDSCTFEAWVRWNGGGPWQRVFDLGTATNNYFFLTPFSGSEARSAIRTPMFGEQQMLAGSALPSGGVLTHVAVTIDDATNTGRLYVDGVLAGPMAENTNVTLRPSDLGAATITYLGKSFWPDPYFNGEIVEFRVYDRALSAADLAQSFAVGPDIAEAVSQDCNENGIPDECDIASGYSQDVNENGIPDECESFDCNDNGIPDECDLTCEGSCAAYPGCGQSQDCNGNGIPDECDIADGTSEDCNENGVPDECDVAMPQLPASLIHRYRFNENANDEVSGAHASLLNGAFIADGAVVLDGVNDMVQLPISATIAGLTDVTFEVWFVWEEGANAAVFTSQTSTQNYLNFSVSTGGSMFSITTPDVGPQSLFGDGITPGQLTHASITINAQDTFGRHYLNGVPGPFNTGMTLTPSALGANTNTLLGRSVFGWAPYFKGNIVEFRIYTEALSAADVLASYEAGPDAGGSRDCNGDGIPDECQLEGNDCNGNGIPDECDISFGTSEDCNENGVPDECDVAMPQLPASLVHRYRFDENGDDEVSGAHAVLLNGAFIADGAVVLDGVDDMVQLPIAATIAGLTDVTFEVWFVWEEGANAAVFTSQTSTQNYLNFSVSDTGSMFSIRTPDIGPQSLAGGGITPDQLTHVAITIDAGSTFGRHYLNGVPGPFNTGMTLTPSDLGAGTNTLLGRSVFSWVPYFKGSISEFRIHTAALSAADVLASNEAGPDAGSGSRDCNEDGIPDECQLENNDCNENGVPDECDIASGFSQDLNENGVPDECEE